VDQHLDEGADATIRTALDRADRDAPAEVMDRGFGSVAVRFGGTVARIAATAETQEGYGREVETLPVLAARLPVAVPAPARPVASGPGVPFGALLHPWLPGEVMTEHDAVRHPTLPDDIASCLAALHAIEPAAFPPGSVPELNPITRLTDLLGQTSAWLDRRLDAAARGRLEDLADAAMVVMRGRRGVVCHADPWYGNMLLDERGRLAALLDVEGLCVADPVYDLAAQTYLTAPSDRRTIGAYIDRTGPQDDLDARLQAYLLMRELTGLAYGIRNDLPGEAEHAFEDVAGLLE
jgi:aminoglycoside phosphotransferase (APT) family kinase protein